MESPGRRVSPLESQHSQLARLLHFPLRSTAHTKLPASVAPKRLFPEESLGDSVRVCGERGNPQTLVKKRAQSGMRRRPKPERRRAQIKPLLAWSPPPILSPFCCVLAPPKVVLGSLPDLGSIFKRRHTHVYLRIHLYPRLAHLCAPVFSSCHS